MTKTINPDVAAFKDDFFKGLSFRECVFRSGRNPASAFLLWRRNQYSYYIVYAGNRYHRAVWILP